MTEKKNTAFNEDNAGNAGKNFTLRGLYLKDLSFENPNFLQHFKTQEQSVVNTSMNISSTPVESNEENAENITLYEVMLHISVISKFENQTRFLVEVDYAGLFDLSGINEKEAESIIHINCASIMFPYARKVISDAIQEGGFPPLLLSPVNFEAMYKSQMLKS